MNEADIRRMKEEQALRVLETLEARVWNDLIAIRSKGHWFASTRIPGMGLCSFEGSTLLDSLSQLAQVLTVDDPGPYDHESDVTHR